MVIALGSGTSSDTRRWAGGCSSSVAAARSRGSAASGWARSAGGIDGLRRIAAFGGVLYAGTSGAAGPTSGLELLLPAFAAAFLGATTINPGRFNAWGTVIAVYFLVTGITGLQLLGAQSFVQNIFYGGALIAAVSFSQFVAPAPAGAQ